VLEVNGDEVDELVELARWSAELVGALGEIVKLWFAWSLVSCTLSPSPYSSKYLRIFANLRRHFPAGTLCEYRAAHKSDPTNHMKSHTGEKPFVCTLCVYTAARQDQLRRHTRGHTDHTAAADGSAAATDTVEESQCVVCLDPTATTCMPCGHQCLCTDSECIAAMIQKPRKCPMCKADVDELLEADKAAAELRKLGKRVYKS
jgi:hypothetical protein